MKGREIEQQDAGPALPVLIMEEMEARLEAQVLGACENGNEDGLCIWYACTDVCPPGG